MAHAKILAGPIKLRSITKCSVVIWHAGPMSCTEQWQREQLISIVEFVHDCWRLQRAWDILSCQLAKQQEFVQYSYKLPSQFVLHMLDSTKQVFQVILSPLDKSFIGLYFPQNSKRVAVDCARLFFHWWSLVRNKDSAQDTAGVVCSSHARDITFSFLTS